MFILIDTREHADQIGKIIDTFQQERIEYDRTKLYVGDYMDYLHPELVIDRKHNFLELAANCTEKRDRSGTTRFVRELQRAKAIGARIVILVEQNSYEYRGKKIDVDCLADLMLWAHPRTDVPGEKIYRVFDAWCHKYPMSVQFCDKRSTGRRIVEILGGKQ